MAKTEQNSSRFVKYPGNLEEKSVNSEICKKLETIVGDSQWVNTDIEVLMNYSMDMTEQVAPTLAEVVVMPQSTQEVSAIMKLANKNEIPVVPYAAGANVGGLTLPHEGGLVIDFKRMGRLVKINRENKFIVVEPGFTFGDLKREFGEGGKLRGFRYSFPFAPPYTSVLTNALLNGLGSLGVLYGCANNFISGLEVVLPNGKIVQIGQNAINKGKYWIAREPLPDMTGIFVATQGTMGIVTKIGLHLIKQPQYSINYAVLPKSADNFLRSWVHELDELDVCDEIGCGYFPAKVAHGIVQDEDLIDLMGKLAGLIRNGKWARLLQLFGWPVLKAITLNNPFPLIKFLANKNLLPLPEVDDDEPLMISGITITAETKSFFKAKVREFKKFMRKQEALVIKPEEFGELADVFNSILDLPAQLPAFYDLRGGGLTWVGSYVPHTNVADGLAKGHEILKELDFFPVVVLRPMKKDHYFVLRFIIAFNSSDKREVERAREAVDRVADVILDCGGTPYKMAPPIAKKIWDKADPSFYEFIAKIKDCVDPKGILNPGKLLVNGTPKNPYKLKDLTGKNWGEN